jgi:uncharacterized membrane protein
MRALNAVFPVLLLAACSQPAPPPAPASTPEAEAATAAAVVPTEVASEAAWHAFGNEPFWSVEARGGTLVFTTPEDQAGVTLQGRRVPSLVGTVITGRGEAGEFHLGITPGNCSDGMSDRTHAYNATFSYLGQDYKGCAEAR